MSYESLGKIFYKYPDRYEKIYTERFNSPTTKHSGLNIKQFNRAKEYPAFLCYPEELLSLTEKIYRKHEIFSATVREIPDFLLRQFALYSVLDEVQSTNDIEGVRSTRRELKAIIEGTSGAARFAGIIDKYQNLISGKKYKFETCEDIRNFYDEFTLEEVAIENDSNIPDGKIFRKESVDVTSGTGKTLHRGVYPESKIIEMMSAALKILNDREIPTLVRISIFHYFFGYIHPFYDGNGRTARFIVSYHLAENFHYLLGLRLSVTIKRQVKKYYKLFTETDSELNRGDLTPFVLGFVSIIADTFDEVNATLKRKIGQFELYEKKLKDLFPKDEFTEKFYRLLLQAGLFFGRGISVSELVEETGKSSNTIRAKLKSLPPEHLKITGKKKFFYKLNMNLFRNGKKSYSGDKK